MVAEALPSQSHVIQSQLALNDARQISTLQRILSPWNYVSIGILPLADCDFASVALLEPGKEALRPHGRLLSSARIWSSQPKQKGVYEIR